ncbi:LysR family transcriptional regulator substrate-binding protein [Streptomyces sulfonofaciens]
MPAPVPDRFTATVVADEEIALVAPTDHPPVREPLVRIQDLDGVRLVHFTPENGLGARLVRSFSKAGIRPEGARAQASGVLNRCQQDWVERLARAAEAEAGSLRADPLGCTGCGRGPCRSRRLPRAPVHLVWSRDSRSGRLYRRTAETRPPGPSSRRGGVPIGRP